MIYGGSSWGVKDDFFEKNGVILGCQKRLCFFLGSTGDLLGWFLCNRLSFWRGSRTVLGTFFPADFLSSETTRTGRKPAETARNRPKPAIHEVKALVPGGQHGIFLRPQSKKSHPYKPHLMFPPSSMGPTKLKFWSYYQPPIPFA